MFVFSRNCVRLPHMIFLKKTKKHQFIEVNLLFIKKTKKKIPSRCFWHEHFKVNN